MRPLSTRGFDSTGPSWVSAQIEGQGKFEVGPFRVNGNWAWGVTEAAEPGQTTAFGFIRVDRELLVGSSTRMNHVISAAADGVIRPGIHNVKDQRTVNRDIRMEAGIGLPGPVTDTSYEFSSLPGRMKRHGATVA